MHTKEVCKICVTECNYVPYWGERSLKLKGYSQKLLSRKIGGEGRYNKQTSDKSERFDKGGGVTRVWQPGHTSHFGVTQRHGGEPCLG